MGRYAKPTTTLREIAEKFEKLARDAEERGDHRGATSAQQQRMYAVEKLMEHELQKRQSDPDDIPDRDKRISLSVLDEIVASVKESHQQCPLCGGYTSLNPPGNITGKQLN
jgi:hypothetical protein